MFLSSTREKPEGEVKSRAEKWCTTMIYCTNTTFLLILFLCCSQHCVSFPFVLVSFFSTGCLRLVRWNFLQIFFNYTRENFYQIAVLMNLFHSLLISFEWGILFEESDGLTILLALVVYVGSLKRKVF